MNMHSPSKAARNAKRLQDVRDMLRVLDAQLVTDIVRMNDSRTPDAVVNWDKYADEFARIGNAIRRTR